MLDKPSITFMITMPGRLVTIEKIGRKWLTIDRGRRVDKETLYIDSGGYAPQGRCWLSEEDYNQYTALHKTWQTFRDRVVECRYRGPDGMTVEKINQASAILFGE